MTCPTMQGLEKQLAYRKLAPLMQESPHRSVRPPRPLNICFVGQPSTAKHAPKTSEFKSSEQIATSDRWRPSACPIQQSAHNCQIKSLHAGLQWSLPAAQLCSLLRANVDLLLPCGASQSTETDHLYPNRCPRRSSPAPLGKSTQKTQSPNPKPVL